MREKNYRTLREALDKLPTYPAPALRRQPSSPARSDGTRLTTAAETRLTTKLPTYAPPPAVWNGVNEGLGRRHTSTRRLPYRVMAIAAAVLLLLVAAVGLLTYDGGPRVHYAYDREAAPEAIVADWNDDEASFARARQEIARRDEPQLNSLGHELDELDAARDEVVAMLTAYGDDPMVVRQLAEIERERDDIYRRVLVEL